MGSVDRQVRSGFFYVTQSVFKAVLLKSTSPQIRQLILYYYVYKAKLTDLSWSWLLQNDSKNTVRDMLQENPSTAAEPRRKNWKGVKDFHLGNGSSQGHNMASAVLYMPRALDSGFRIISGVRIISKGSGDLLGFRITSPHSSTAGGPRSQDVCTGSRFTLEGVVDRFLRGRRFLKKKGGEPHSHSRGRTVRSS